MSFLSTLKKIVPVFAYVSYKSEVVIHTSINYLHVTLFCLKKHINYQYSLLSCISGVDNIYSRYRFNIVYDLLSVTYSSRIRIKIYLNEITAVPSICNVFINANWWEREIWD